MKTRHLIFVLPAIAAAWAPSVASAERLFIGVLEADGYQPALFGATAFSRVADLPLALELANGALEKQFNTPSFACVAPSETFRIVQTVDPDQPPSNDNPSNVSILPLAGSEAIARSQFAAAYSVQRESPPFTLYEQPKASNAASRVVIAFAGRHLMTSTSLDAMRWAWANKDRLTEAPQQSIPGLFRVLVNPQRLADLAGARGSAAASFLSLENTLRDFETLSFALSLDGQALELTLRGKPKEGTALAKLVAGARPPQHVLWNGVPDDALFVSLLGTTPPLWSQYAGDVPQLPFPTCRAVPRESLSGETLSYLVPTADRRGLCWVSVQPVQDPESVKAALRSLHRAADNGSGLSLSPLSSRLKGDAEIVSYALSFKVPVAADNGQSGRPQSPSTLFTLASLFMKQAVFEAAVAEGALVSCVGPANAIDLHLKRAKRDTPPVTMERKILAQAPVLSSPLTHAATLQLASLLRHVVSILPGVKPEHLRAFPLGGDGMAVGASQDSEGRLTVSLRVQSGEIAALQRINKDGRAVLQELVFQLFSNQLLQLQESPPERKP